MCYMALWKVGQGASFFSKAILGGSFSKSENEFQIPIKFIAYTYVQIHLGS